ncbi:hypothetical protein OBBRIDRAFT_826798 [Obba rivulosa]|uniref:SEC7 domain-containing protein n=1 Tax=Obba rivulosa TaxID=1052685 RepID=A0A8E2DJG2_9APHY|nr:hypothetical protein OBBRIDRAFT_826798 [Obba rivulosa]
MDNSSVAEQRATAVAKLKRAASLPRMKDGRRPPMHVEAVSEGERVEDDGRDDGSAHDSDARAEEEAQAGPSDVQANIDEADVPSPETPVASGPTPVRAKRRSRSRTRSRGSRDFKGKAVLKQPSTAGSASHANESSADEYYNTSAVGEDAPPSPPLVSPIPSHIIAGLPASRLLRSPASPLQPLLYPGTTPPTPTLPSLDDLSRGIGLFRSNSAGAARAMAMSKLTGGTETDYSHMSPSPTPDQLGRLTRNNTVAGGERLAARRLMLNRLGNRLNQADGDQTSGGEEPTPIAPKRRRRRSKRASSRASTVVDDRDEREPPSTSPNTPIVPPSPLPRSFTPATEPPRAPSAAGHILNGNARSPTPQHGQNEDARIEYEKPTGHRGVVVEEEDDIPERLSPPRLPQLPSIPVRGFAQSAQRLPHTSDAPSFGSSDSPGASVPVFLSRTQSSRQDIFPASPFATPLREKPYPYVEEDEDLYQDLRLRPRVAFERESEISWVADLVPERIPLHDDDEDEDTDDEGAEPEPEPEREHELEPELEPDPDPQQEQEQTEELPPAPEELQEHRLSVGYDTGAPHVPPQLDLVVDLEISPETSQAAIPPSPSSLVALSGASAAEPQSGTQPSPATYPMRLSVAMPSQVERSPSGENADWDESRSNAIEAAAKASASTWEKVKGAFSRSNSSNGRRSRTNSIGIRDRRHNNTDSSVSRESGVSHTSGKTDKGEVSGTFAQQQVAPPLMQAPSASASILSLTPQSAPLGGSSPVPPASSADLLKYADSKLFPFPGMIHLEEQRNRARAMTPSASSPDVTVSIGLEAVNSTSSSSTATRVTEVSRERKLSHQASDTRLFTKYNGVTFPQQISTVPSSASQVDYFSVPSRTTPPSSQPGSLKLPTNREGVRKWLKLFSPGTNGSSTSPASPPSVASSHSAGKKPSLTELFTGIGRKDNDLTDWEEIGHDKSRTPTSPPNSTPVARQMEANGKPPSPPMDANGHHATNGKVAVSYVVADYPPEFPSPPDPPSSTTPDPQSSLDEFPARSITDSFSSSSQQSPRSPMPETGQSAVVMERLDEILGRGSKGSSWPSVLDDPPRKLVLSSPVLQVTNANTVKDRFLFLFNDILVIAKPIVQDPEALLDPSKPSPTDRKFIVKSVVQLRELRFSGDRDELRGKASHDFSSTKNPVIRSFVHNFSRDPDHAVSALFEKTNTRIDPVIVGQLLFKTLDIDRAKLGDYLSRRTSKVILKAYVDNFGLMGLRIDKALRVFLQSVSIPSRSSGHSSALEYLLDSFASRWYEANAGIVMYDKDVAIRLVRSIVQLNDVMHGGIAQEAGITGYPKRNIITRDFVEAFRRSDSRGLVSDELLEKVYASVRKERLSQARNLSSQNTYPDVPITIKRPLPARLTYRQQSDPVILRIPQPDPQLTIQLYGQDLVFDPPALSFAKSSEASFRVTGNSLGPKSIIMWRSGPNALAYSGLPLSSPVMVERSFMRNTFQLAFVNHTGAKRKYMFSVDDPLIRHQWAVSLQRQISIASSSSPSSMGKPGPPDHVQKAHETLAFKVLQETLITQDIPSTSNSTSPIDQAFARLTGMSPRQGDSGFSSIRGSPVISGLRIRGEASSPHARSKSRSKMYRHGAGKLEPDSPDARTDDDPYQLDAVGETTKRETRLWNGHDLEMVCRQNSSIPFLLAYLQVGHLDDLPNGTSPPDS